MIDRGQGANLSMIPGLHPYSFKQHPGIFKGEMKQSIFQVYMIYKMDFHYNQQLYKKQDKCKHLKEKTLYLSPPGRHHCLVSILICDVTGLVGFSLTGSGQ